MDSKVKQEFNLKKRTLSRNVIHSLGTYDTLGTMVVVVLYIRNTDMADKILMRYVINVIIS